MSSDIAKVNFSSEYAIDKILTDELTASYSISAGAPGSPINNTHTIAHTLGKSAFITYAFSIDNSNFYSQGNPIRLVDTAPYAGQLGTVNVDASVDATTVYFYVSNDYNAAVTVYIRYVLDNIL